MLVIKIPPGSNLAERIDWISEWEPFGVRNPFHQDYVWRNDIKVLSYRCHYIMRTMGGRCLLVFPHLGHFTGHRPYFPIELKYTHTDRKACTRYTRFVLNPDPAYRRDWQARFGAWLFQEVELTLGEVSWADFWRELDADAYLHDVITYPQDFHKQAWNQTRTEKDLSLPCAFAFALPLEGFEHRAGEIRITAVDWGAEEPLWAVWCQCPGTHPREWLIRFRVEYPIFEAQHEALAFAEALKIELETEND